MSDGQSSSNQIQSTIGVRSGQNVQSSQIAPSAQSSQTAQSQLVSPASKRKNIETERRNKSDVWCHMEKNLVENKIICKVGDCTKTYSLTSGNTTLYDHLAKVHGLKKGQTNESESDDSEPPVSPKTIKRGFSDQDRITDLFLNFVISNNQAFALADDKNFRKFVFSLNHNYVLPDRKTVRDKIRKKYEKEFVNIKNLLLNLDSKVSLTSDIWTSMANDPYLSVTCHFIDNEWTLRNFLLDTFHFPHPHDGAFIYEAVKEV